MKIKVSKYNLNIHYGGSRGREDVELSNKRTAYVMHIPNTLSLTSARKNRKQKFQERSSSVNFILIMLLHMLFFTAAIFLCAVQNQGITLTEHFNFLLNNCNDLISFKLFGKLFHIIAALNLTEKRL